MSTLAEARERSRIKRETARTRNVTLATNPALRSDGVVPAAGYSGRKGKTRYAGAGARGYRDAWNGSPYYKSAATIDARWSA